MTNKELFTLYMRAYTSKKAADSVADDIAVGAGSAAAGGFTSNLLLSKNVNRAKNLLNKINSKINDTKLEQTSVNNLLKHINDYKNSILDRLNKLSNRNTIADIEKARTLHDRLKRQTNIDNYYSKMSKNLSDRVSSLLSRRPLYKLNRLRKLRLKGTVGGAAITGILGSLLYNKLKES